MRIDAKNSEKVIQLKLSREIDRKRVTVREWRERHKKIHPLGNGSKAIIVQKSAATKKSGTTGSAKFSTIRIKKGDFVRSGQLTLKEHCETTTLSGVLRLTSQAKSIALLLPNGTRLDLLADKASRIKFDDIQLEEKINIKNIFFIVLD